MKNTISHDFGQPKTPATLNPFVFTWEFCATSGKGKNKTYKTLLSGKTTVTDVFSVYKRAEKEAGEKGIKKGNNILLKCYLIPSENPLDIQRVALHAAKIIAGAKKYNGNSTMDKVNRELSYICAYIGGETACKSELAEGMLNSAVLNCSDDTRNFLQEANLSAWANRDKTPENLYSAIYSDLHKFIHKEQKYKEYNTYIIFQEDLLYRLASHKLLHKLCGATRSKHVEGAYVWFFEKGPEVFKVIKEYNAEKRAEHNTDADHSN